MKWFLKMFRGFLISIISLVIVDMFVLKGQLKMIFVRANTTDYSPFSTDGQSNYVLIIVGIIGIMLCSYFICRYSTIKEEPPKKEEKNDAEI